MTLMMYVDRHPWWTLVFLLVLAGFAGDVLTAVLAAIAGRRK